MMKHLDIKNSDLHLFFRFLKEKGIYKTYFREVKRNDSNWSTLNALFKGDLSRCLVENAFSTAHLIDITLDWRKTELGFEHWENMNDEYITFLSAHKKCNKK